MNVNGTKNFASYDSFQTVESNKLLKVLISTQRDLKQIRNNINMNTLSNISSGISSNSNESFKAQKQNLNAQLQELKIKYNELIISQEDNRKSFQIILAQKNQEIQILEKLLRSQYIKQMLLQANIKNYMKKQLSQQHTKSIISENLKNSIILGIYNSNSTQSGQKSPRQAVTRLSDMLAHPPRMSRIQSQRIFSNPPNRVDKIRESLNNLKGLKRQFGNDSKFRQDVLDL